MDAIAEDWRGEHLIRRRTMPNPQTQEEREIQVIALAACGASLTEAARRVGLPVTTTRSIARRNNIAFSDGRLRETRVRK